MAQGFWPPAEAWRSTARRRARCRGREWPCHESHRFRCRPATSDRARNRASTARRPPSEGRRLRERLARALFRVRPATLPPLRISPVRRWATAAGFPDARPAKLSLAGRRALEAPSRRSSSRRPAPPPLFARNSGEGVERTDSRLASASARVAESTRTGNVSRSALSVLPLGIRRS